MNQAPQKKKGPIRFEAIIPVGILCTITFVYFSYYFDQHLKSGIEYVATQGNGAEVNVGSVHTSFLQGSFKLEKLEVTDKEQPTLNLIEIEKVHFKYLWDALLRFKFVVDDASIDNIQIGKPRKNPGKVLPPEPAKPSKLTEIQDQVLSQVKGKYSGNVLGDAVTLLDGGDYKDKIQEIRETLKSEARVNEMIQDVQTKKTFWDQKIKSLSDTSQLKSLEAQIQEISKEKNFIKQMESLKKITEGLSKTKKQLDEIKDSAKKLESEVKVVSSYPQEVKKLIDEDIAALKGRFAVPKIDFKEMAMHLFAGEFAETIAKARKYHALAKQYIPEKKDEEPILPPKRAEGKTYHFPTTKSYPLFWLKRAAISSKGTESTYSGQVSGELLNVTTEPKLISKPLELILKGDFNSAELFGVKLHLILDHSTNSPLASAQVAIASFPVKNKMFVQSDKLTFGLEKATGSSELKLKFQDQILKAQWTSSLSRLNYKLESSSSLAKEMLQNILQGIPKIQVNGLAEGPITSLQFDLKSNLGDDLSQGISREVGTKVAEAQAKIQSMIDAKINKPKADLDQLTNGFQMNGKTLQSLQDLYKKNEDKIKEEIEKIKKGGAQNSLDDLKSKGKKLLKGIKF